MYVYIDIYIYSRMVGSREMRGDKPKTEGRNDLCKEGRESKS